MPCVFSWVRATLKKIHAKNKFSQNAYIPPVYSIIRKGELGHIKKYADKANSERAVLVQLCSGFFGGCFLVLFWVWFLLTWLVHRSILMLLWNMYFPPKSMFICRETPLGFWFCLEYYNYVLPEHQAGITKLPDVIKRT